MATPIWNIAWGIALGFIILAIIAWLLAMLLMVFGASTWSNCVGQVQGAATGFLGQPRAL